jgi:hypothetical protein
MAEKVEKEVASPSVMSMVAKWRHGWIVVNEDELDLLLVNETARPLHPLIDGPRRCGPLDDDEEAPACHGISSCRNSLEIDR